MGDETASLNQSEQEDRETGGKSIDQAPMEA